MARHPLGSSEAACGPVSHSSDGSRIAELGQYPHARGLYQCWRKLAIIPTALSTPRQTGGNLCEPGFDNSGLVAAIIADHPIFTYDYCATKSAGNVAN